MIEIERKFLVTSSQFITDAFRSSRIVQGYLSSNPARTVRIRIKGDKGYLTIKGVGNESGLSRFEWETEIPVTDAERLLILCETGIIDKIRHEVKFKNHIIEVDVFAGANEGLTIAEIELESEKETVEKPAWLGLEVTSDEKYYNAYLSKNPFQQWT
jgi:CYTH domain-containing protein